MGCCASAPLIESELQDGKQTEKEVLKNLNAEGKSDALLAMIPGRMFSNGASNNACVFTQQGRKGTNQDAMVVWENFASMEDTIFCGVFDGHGPYGHLVARRVRDSVPSKILHFWEGQQAHQVQFDQEIIQQSRIPDNDVENETVLRNESSECRDNGSESKLISAETAEEVREHSMFNAWKESHLTAYKVMDKELRSHPGIDCFCSGTTAVTVLKQGKHLVIGNVGDSRAILGSRDENGIWRAVQLTVDLKPNLPREADRIRQCRGCVFALQDEPEVPRVWLPFDDTPGLAMARAFGDFCLKDYGVIAVPEMSYRQLTEQDQFIVLATDGIWDVLSTDEVVQVIARAPTRVTAARALVESAVRVWKLRYPTSKVDDCAVVCLYVSQTSSAPSEGSIPKEISKRNDIHSYSLCSNELHGASRTPMTSLSSRHQNPQASQSSETEIAAEKPSVNPKTSMQSRKLVDWLGAREHEDEEWSALEGVTRVNSLLNLPRRLQQRNLARQQQNSS